MGLFGNKRKEAIPEVASAPSTASYSTYDRAPSASYNTPASSRPDYNARPSYASSNSSRSAGPPSGYGGQMNQNSSNYGGQANARSELLAGANPSARQGDRYAPQTGGDTQYDNEDEEVEGIKQQMRFTKQASLASTRNALRLVNEAEETAMGTLTRLGDQNDRLANARHHIDLASSHNVRANDQVTEIKALNKSIFRPNLTINKQAKRDKEEARIRERHQAEQFEREQNRGNQIAGRNAVADAQGKVRQMQEDSAMRRGQGQRNRNPNERSRYQFEATASDDEVEDEIDSNLDEIGGAVGRLKMLALAAGDEVTRSTKQITSMSERVDEVDVKVVNTTARMARIKG